MVNLKHVVHECTSMMWELVVASIYLSTLYASVLVTHGNSLYKHCSNADYFVLCKYHVYVYNSHRKVCCSKLRKNSSTKQCNLLYSSIDVRTT